MMYRNLYRSKIQVWTQYLNRKCTKDQLSNSETVLHQSKKQKKFNTSTTRSDDIHGKTWLWQNLYGFKKENTQTYDRHN